MPHAWSIPHRTVQNANWTDPFHVQHSMRRRSLDYNLTILMAQWVAKEKKGRAWVQERDADSQGIAGATWWMRRQISARKKDPKTNRRTRRRHSRQKADNCQTLFCASPQLKRTHSEISECLSAFFWLCLKNILSAQKLWLSVETPSKRGWKVNREEERA